MQCSNANNYQALYVILLSVFDAVIEVVMPTGTVFNFAVNKQLMKSRSKFGALAKFVFIPFTRAHLKKKAE